MEDGQVKVCAWVRNHRCQKEMGFLDIYDGTAFGVVQVVYDNSLADFEQIQKINIGSAVQVEGKLRLQ